MAESLYELDVRLQGIAPPIWRTIEMPGSSTLEELHFAIQVAMGWELAHMHQFVIDGKRYGRDDEGEGDIEDQTAVRLQDVAGKGKSFVYEYDFGDGWEHAIKVTKVAVVAKAPRPRCIAGERACPPEDCGGPHGYTRLLQILGDKSHEEYAEMRDWVGPFKPERYSVPKKGLDLQPGIDELREISEDEGAAEGVEYDEDDGLAALPPDLVEAVLALEPMQRASLAALIAGSLASELLDMRGQTSVLVDALQPTDPERER